MPALSATIKALTQPGDKVLVQTPVYNCFFSSIRNNGCEIVESPLQRSANTYVINFDDLEQKLSAPSVKRFVLFASVSEASLNNSVTLNSPSKSFNTAGLQIANIISNDATIRQRINRAININEVCDVNPFGIIALQAAYNEGEAWLDALKAYLHANYVALQAFFSEHLPQLAVTKLEGTYLVGVDISSTGLDADTLTDRLLHEAKVMVNSGTMYGREAGKQFIRINIACPKARLMEALKRIKLEIDNLSTL